jgi:hypothetical protein
MKIVELIVNKKYDEGDIRFNLFVDLMNDKIIGNYTKEMFVNAIDTYISANFRSLMRDKQSYFDTDKGKLVHRDTTEIFKELRRELYLAYNGNFK